jgi:hypothetical protein
MTTVTVTLTEYEMQIAYTVAVQRLSQNMALKRKNTHGQTVDSLDDHALGTISEMGLAKYVGRYWSGAVGNIKAKDVGSLQARASYNPRAGLILHPDDPDEDRFFLITVQQNVCTIHGWVLGSSGKQQEFWDPKRADGSRILTAGRPAFLIPQGSPVLIGP